MKLAQIASFISDDVPEQYRTALRQLQTSAPPMTFALAREVVEADLGQPLAIEDIAALVEAHEESASAVTRKGWAKRKAF